MRYLNCRNGTAGLSGLLLLCCGGVYEDSVRHDLARQRDVYASTTENLPSRRAAAPDVSGAPGVNDSGDVNGARDVNATANDTALRAPVVGQGPSAYVARALANHPELRASYERWRASVFRISRARRLPDPMLGFGYFFRSVETRVGPQQARISLQQTFPWPTKLTAGADAASAQARASQRRFEAQALTVSRQVVTAYWNLWQIRRTRALQAEHIEVVSGLSETVGARVSTGAANLAELQQVDLTSARLRDSLRGMDEAERSAEARLRSAIGLSGNVPVPTAQLLAEVALPQETPEQLLAAVDAHPIVSSARLLAEAADSSAQAEAAEGLPSLTLGADWIITGEAVMPDVMESGKDALIVAATVRIPLWQASYSDSVEAVRADANVQRAEQRALINRAYGELGAALSSVRDSVRRVELYRDTLVHLAESAYESVLGAYTVGKGTVAQMLLAQRDLLDLRMELVRARADYARAWAWLEEVTGREIHPAASKRDTGENVQ